MLVLVNISDKMKDDNCGVSRIGWVDNVKLFGLFLIVLGHFTPHKNETLLTQVIYSFHVPLFFIISGYLSKPIDDKVEQFVKISKRLLFPYICFCFIGVVLLYLVGCVGGNNIITVRELVLCGFGMPANFFAPLWFVFTLYLVRSLDILISDRKFLNYSYKGIIIIVILIILSVCPTYCLKQMPSYLSQSIWLAVGYIYFAVGGVQTYRENYREKDN